MTYPLDQIVIIAPILFLVMMVAFPIIGVFGGWKRAAYWGGGNFLFYCIGLIIWVFAHGAMANTIVDLIKKIVGQSGEADFTKLAASVLAPIYFIGLLLVSNLILLINYYAWFKRVAGLSKWKTVKKKDKNGNVVKTKVKAQANTSTRYKVINMTVGGVAMGALMLPTTFAFTNALFFTTTSYKTRPKSSFASSFYNALVGTDCSMSWLSYYSNVNDCAKDYDALFAALAMKNEKITIHLPGTPEGELVEESLVDALADTLNEGLGQIYTETRINEESPIGDIIKAVNDMIASWNLIVNQAYVSMIALFNSPNGTQVVCQLVTGNAILDPSEKMTHDVLEKRYTGPDAVFPQAVDLYMKGDPRFEQEARRIPVSQASFDNMVEALVNLYVFDETEQPGDKDAFRVCMGQLLSMLFEVK